MSGDGLDELIVSNGWDVKEDVQGNRTRATFTELIDDLSVE
jgi:hypothetical protein